MQNCFVLSKCKIVLYSQNGKYDCVHFMVLFHLWQIEKLDIGHTGDIVYVYLHRGAIVAGKEVNVYY
jgi:hypothetical protein